VVAAGPEDDRPLLVHGDVPGFGGADAVPQGLQVARRRVAAVEREAAAGIRRAGARAAGAAGARVADQHAGDVVRGLGRVGREVVVLVVLPARVDAVLGVRHDPGAVVVAAGKSGSPDDAAAQVHRLHRAVAVVVRVGLGVAVVEATAVDQRVLGVDHVDGL